MLVKEILLSEEQILIEGVVSSLRGGLNAMKSYFSNLAKLKGSHATLKSRDGARGFEQSELADEARKYREQVKELYQDATPKVKGLVDSLLKKANVSSVDKINTSRNYYKDFIVFYVVFTFLSLTKNTILEKGLEVVADKLFGMALTVLTGIPSIDDIRDVAQFSKVAVQVSNDLATKINSLA